jgi:protein-L-isoaspartate(D-aspartate) O-methyltransferase
VLEIGTGSGYLTAVLARLARRVLTIDRWRTLVSEAEERLRAVEILNVTMMVADGRNGWTTQAPFDRIVSTASLTEVPQGLADQLAEGGRMILPIGNPGDQQRLVAVDKVDGGIRVATIMPVRASPMTAGVAERL